MAAKTVMTPIGTLCFADQVFTPKSQEAGKTPRYTAMLLFDSTGTSTTAYAELRKLVQDAAAEKWGAAKAQDPAFMRSLRLPFRPAAEKDYEGFDKGEIYITPWNEKAPGVVDLHGNDMVPTDVWSGQLARATVRAFAYDTNGNKGVSLGLEHVQIVKQDMPRIDGRRSASAAFSNAATDDQFKALGIDPSAPSSSGGDMPW